MGLNIRDKIEELLDMNVPKILQLYRKWDKGDCSDVGLIEILLFQEIQKHKNQHRQYYDTDYDRIKLRIE